MNWFKDSLPDWQGQRPTSELTQSLVARGSCHVGLGIRSRIQGRVVCLWDCEVVQTVCEAIVEEYFDGQMTCPTTEKIWCQISDDWLKWWNFSDIIGAIDGKHVSCKAPPRPSPTTNWWSEYYLNNNQLQGLLRCHTVFHGQFWLQVPLGWRIWEWRSIGCSNIQQQWQEPLPNDMQGDPYFLLVDDLFALRTFLMNHTAHRVQALCLG